MGRKAEKTDIEKWEPIPEPVGNIILKAVEDGIIHPEMTPDGAWYHYADVCKLLALTRKDSPIGEQNISDQEQVAQILRDNIHFSGQVGDYVIHGAIQKIIEWADARKGSPIEK